MVEEFYASEVGALVDEFGGMGAAGPLAREIAWAVALESRKAGINPWFTVAIIKIENPWLKADTASFAGAMGIMQIMPFHSGNWGCGEDLTNVRVNVCHGTRIMAGYLNRQWDVMTAEANRLAMLNYNGCVKTPGCERYADLVWGRAHFTKPTDVWLN